MKQLKVELSEGEMEKVDRAVIAMAQRERRRVSRSDLVRAWVGAGCPVGAGEVGKKEAVEKAEAWVGAGEVVREEMEAKKEKALASGGVVRGSQMVARGEPILKPGGKIA